MTVVYERPIPTQACDDRVLMEAIQRGPAYARSRAAGRWHRVRYATRRLCEWGEDLVDTYHYWCGPFTQRPILTDIPPAGEPLCGTCEGRFRGASRTDDWLFLPSTARIPKRCPGSRTDTLYADIPGSHRVFRCLVCGDLVGGRYAGGPYSGRWGLVNHPPGAGLVRPCDIHGWLALMKAGGTVRCRCGS